MIFSFVKLSPSALHLELKWLVLAQEFFQKDCWRHHPKPYADYMDLKKRQDEELAASRKKLIPGLA